MFPGICYHVVVQSVPSFCNFCKLTFSFSFCILWLVGDDISSIFSSGHSSPSSKFECNGTSKRNDMKSVALRRMAGAGKR